MHPDDAIKPGPQVLDDLLRAEALALHSKDEPPATRKAWEECRTKLRAAMIAAMGSFPEKVCALESKEMGVLKRDGYRIEKLLIQTRPEIWMTANAYVPEPAKDKVPAVLVVHGHWPWARRDPVVQARCLGLVKLGYFVLAVDAFGAGERYTKPGRGTYHGALYGSTLWPTGQTLLGMQVYDNRRAVDYLLTRPEVEGNRLGITGASGGGNQSMYAGALDDRFAAVVPVCSVGTYQAYLHAACCVCEVLPGALRFAEEGDVLDLIAPRALLVINATKDAFQFSIGEAEKSIARARPVFKLFNAEIKLAHATFESPHGYNQAMRETMYGWMTRWLKNEGEGKPIPEPKHTVEQPEDLSCFSDQPRPQIFLLLPQFAAREASRVLAKSFPHIPDHREEWEAVAMHMRTLLRKEILGSTPEPVQREASEGTPTEAAEATSLVLLSEQGMPLPFLMKKPKRENSPVCVLLHLEGKAEAIKHPLAASLTEKGWTVLAPDLRGTGETRPTQGGIAGAPDHHIAEHGLWVGRPVLGQWVVDVSRLVDWVHAQKGIDKDRVALVGVGQAGIIALCASGLLENRVGSTAVVDCLSSYVTDQPYATGTYMGLLVPGILKVGDVPHLAALSAPRRLLVAGGVSPQGKKLTTKELKGLYSFTTGMFKLHGGEEKLTIKAEMKADEIASAM
jgi:dienelactone hydrolase